MKKTLYEAVVGNYAFQMVEDDIIEVWETNTDLENPLTYIFLKPGEIDSEKSFQLEAMDWWNKNAR